MSLCRFAIMFAFLVALVVTAAPSLELTNDNFYDYLAENQDKPVMVKFYMNWCKHCSALAPVWDQLSEEDNGVQFVGVNCEQNKAICQDFEVKGYPTLKLFHNLKYADFEGPRDEDFIVSFAKNTVPETPVEIPLPPLVRELLHDLNEIWAIRRNALGVIVTAAFLIGAIFSCMCCGSKSVKAKKD